MIHEVMVLDHGGPDLAFILYGAALKLWVLGGLLVGLAVPVRTGHPLLDIGAFLAGMGVLAWRSGSSNLRWRGSGCCAFPSCWWGDRAGHAGRRAGREVGPCPSASRS